jgi:hypothetical protein
LIKRIIKATAGITYDDKLANHICQSSSYQEEDTRESEEVHLEMLSVSVQTSSPLEQEAVPVETDHSLQQHPPGHL